MTRRRSYPTIHATPVIHEIYREGYKTKNKKRAVDARLSKTSRWRCVPVFEKITPPPVPKPRIEQIPFLISSERNSANNCAEAKKIHKGRICCSACAARRLPPLVQTSP